MIEIVCASHSEYALAIKKTVSMIAGKQISKELHALSLQEDLLQFKKDVATLKKRVHGKDILILTDLYGASPFNVCYQEFQEESFQIISGMNIPMVLEAIFHRNLKLPDLVQYLLKQSRKSIDVPHFEDNEDDFFET